MRCDTADGGRVRLGGRRGAGLVVTLRGRAERSGGEANAKRESRASKASTLLTSYCLLMFQCILHTTYYILHAKCYILHDTSY